MFSTFPLKSSAHQLIIVLNSQSHNFNISAISESGSDACFVPSNCVLSFSISYNFFVDRRHMMSWVKGTAVNRLLVMYSVVTFVHLKVAKRMDLKNFHHRKEKKLQLCGDGC